MGKCSESQPLWLFHHINRALFREPEVQYEALSVLALALPF